MKTLAAALLCAILASPTFADSGIALNTSLGKVTASRKNSPEDLTWVIRWNGKTIHEMVVDMFSDATPDFGQIGEFGDEVAIPVSSGMHGSVCPGGDIFLIVLHKNQSAKVLTVPNECLELKATKVDGRKMILTLYNGDALLYDKGRLVRSNIRATKSHMSRNAPTSGATSDRYVTIHTFVDSNLHNCQSLAGLDPERWNDFKKSASTFKVARAIALENRDAVYRAPAGNTFLNFPVKTFTVVGTPDSEYLVVGFGLEGVSRDIHAAAKASGIQVVNKDAQYGVHVQKDGKQVSMWCGVVGDN